MKAAASLLLALTGCMTVSHVRSQTAERVQPRRIAFLLGNAHYDANDPLGNESYLRNLEHPCSDTEQVKQSLTKHRFEIDSYCDLNKTDFDEKSTAFAKKLMDLPKGSLVFIYYSGHGMQINGFPFIIPVKFRFDQKTLEADVDADRITYFRANADDMERFFGMLPNDYDIAIVVAIDACRNFPFLDDNSLYNQNVSVATQPNMLIQYATTPNSTTQDDGVYARVLSEELMEGKDIAPVMARVSRRIWSMFKNQASQTQAIGNAGNAFLDMDYVPLTVDQAKPVQEELALKDNYHWSEIYRSHVGTFDRHTGELTFNVSLDRRPDLVIGGSRSGNRVDVFWCADDDADIKYNYATHIANQLDGQHADLNIGSLKVHRVSNLNNPAYPLKIRHNLMRYDAKSAEARDLQQTIADEFPEGNFLPQQIEGRTGGTTPPTVAVYVCGRIDRNDTKVF